MRTDALDYHLPDELIATQAAEPRDSARLLLVRRDTQTVEHHRVRDLPTLGLFKPGDLMLVNQTRVLPAQLTGVRQSTGGRVTGLFVNADSGREWRVMLESRGTLKPGETIRLVSEHHDAEPADIELVESLGNGEWRAQLRADEDTAAVLNRLGRTPLPPYIRKQRKKLGQGEITASDQDRYNTIYAQSLGSVAAPTAGLHFTPGLLDALSACGVQRAAVDLHVGLGTFAPVRSEQLEGHDMHRESYSVPRATLDAIATARGSGNKLIIIGTTTVRALESLPDDALTPDAYPDGITSGTSLFIRPDAGFAFRYTDHLMTNFHLPQSTLLALVASLPGIGLDRLMAIYQEAVDQRYRFYSYGDAMLIV
ncbi:MAG: tRNA preQ1(34) S-adenosylmethionine ribosyltransferase-isomerase QueA [Phycisphaeraceae bacterium]|nr:tRNA preQ1(34) S-adenosylmethionine ribosyltransferase-isomerase QueA [Phycisphaeraceae bacterium]